MSRGHVRRHFWHQEHIKFGVEGRSPAAVGAVGSYSYTPFHRPYEAGGSIPNAGWGRAAPFANLPYARVYSTAQSKPKSERMNVLLISTYELGHQPFGPFPAGGLAGRAPVRVRCLDLAVQPLDWRWREAGLIGLYLPMHTATRLAAELIGRLRELNPRAHLCCYGLYAPLERAAAARPGHRHDPGRRVRAWAGGAVPAPARADERPVHRRPGRVATTNPRSSWFLVLRLSLSPNRPSRSRP